MPYTIEHNELLGIIELTYDGCVTGTDLKESTSECIALGKRTGTTHFLVFATEKDVAASIIDIYNLPSRQYMEEGADVRSRVAVIVPSSQKSREAVRFYETACKNRGWTVQSFPERGSAIDWLIGSSASAA